MQKGWTWTTTGYGLAEKSHDEIIDTCRFAGLAGIEGATPLFEGKTEAELQAIGGSYRSAGLCIETFHLPFSPDDDIASFYETTRRQAVDKMRLWMGRASLIGATVGIQHPTTNRTDANVEGLETYFIQIGKSLDALLREAEGLDFTIALENMLPSGGGRFTSRPGHFERIVRDFAHPNLGFCLDTGHALVAARGDAHRFFEVMGPRMVAFHLADNAGDRDSHLAPGHGRVDWRMFFRHAAQIGYKRTMCIETPPFDFGPDYSDCAWKKMVDDTDALAESVLED